MPNNRHYFFIFILISLCVSAKSLAQNYVPGEIIVRVKGEKDSVETYTFLGKIQAQKGMTLKGTPGNSKIYHFSLKPGEDVEKAIAELKTESQVVYAEPNYYIQSFSYEPTIYNYQDIQGMVAGRSYLATRAKIQAKEAWAQTSTAGEKPIIAVIDTGLDIGHSAFTESQALWANEGEILNGLDDDGNGYVDDLHGWNLLQNSGEMTDESGHGTHIAGIALGVGQDIFTSPVTEAGIQIMPLKFMPENGAGETSDAVEAVFYAVDNGAKILNLSWGNSHKSLALHEALAYAYRSGVVIVAAAGNSNSDNDSQPIYPANYPIPSMISVAATNDSDKRAPFSNFGENSVHIAGPGLFIMSTLPDDLYGELAGTSMAAPFVSGTLALMLVESPVMLGYQLKNLILSSADSANKLSKLVSSQRRLNVLNSIYQAQTASVDSIQPAYKIIRAEGGSAGAAGCGLVKKMRAVPPASTETQGVLLFLVLLAIPSLAAYIIRRKTMRGREQRRYPRFSVNTSVEFQVGGKTLSGAISTVSVGGVKLDTEALIEKGGLVSMKITMPDSDEAIEVEGRVVWQQVEKSYGVQFENVSSRMAHSLREWTRLLAGV